MGASAASAAELPLTIASPDDGQSVLSGAISVTGTGTTGDTITVGAPGGTYEGGTAIVNGDGQWKATLTVPLTASGSRQIEAIDESDDNGTQPALITVDLTPQSNLLRVTSPVSNTSIPSRAITFSGTAPEGSVVALDTDGNANNVAPVTVGASGRWSITTRFEAASPQNVELKTGAGTVRGHDASGTAFVSQSVTGLALPALASTPVITAVTSSGTTVTVSGSATGGPGVAVFFSPQDAAARAAANTLPDGSFEATGVVGAAGRFSATAHLGIGRWSATGVLLDSADVHTANYLSLTSAPSLFTLVAAPATGKPAVPVVAAGGDPAVTTTTAGSKELAYTGSAPTGGLLAGALVLLAGLALVVARRRHVRR
jgi:LPXTG-motif cell wall-anchored protein